MSSSVSGSVRDCPARVPETRIGTHNGMPAVFVDGVPLPAICFSEYLRPTREHHREFAAAGVRLFELSGQLLPADATVAELFQQGLAPHPYHDSYPGGTRDVSLGWVGPEAYDYTWVDRSFEELLAGAPEAYVFPRVWIEPPGWWLDAHPEELQQYGDGRANTDEDLRWAGGIRRVSFASGAWRTQAGEALRRFVRHVQERFSRHIIGYHLAAGIYGEWHSPGMNHQPDTSEPMRRAFAQHLRRKYADDERALRAAWNDGAVSFAAVTVPTKAERQDAGFGVLRNPRTAGRTIDYYECHHSVLAEAVLHFAAAVKEASGRRSLAGFFYGYTRDVGFIHEGGHLSLQPVLRSPDVDFLCSPHAYREREPGQDGGFRALSGSIAHHGKFFMDEQDEETCRDRRMTVAFAPTRNREDAIGTMRRQFAQAATEGWGWWWFEISKDNFEDDALRAEIQAEVRAGREAFDRSRERVSEVAVVVSLESIFRSAHATTYPSRLPDRLINQQWSELFRMGCPFDVFDAEDLCEPGLLDRYRCVLFPNAFYLSEGQRLGVNRLKGGTRTLVWFYAPGALCDQALPPGNDEQLLREMARNASSVCGFDMVMASRPSRLRVSLAPGPHHFSERLPAGLTWGSLEAFTPSVIVSAEKAETLGRTMEGHPGCARRRFDEWTSIYFRGYTVPACVLREVARDAGCHIYIESDDNLYVNRSHLGIHAATFGDKHVRLPRRARVVNLFDPAWSASEAETEGFSCRLRGGETAVFRLEELRRGKP